ncbi:MAG: class I SAM-dependent rRNA methyltransferase, partial [Flavobacteriia bacterium]
MKGSTIQIRKQKTESILRKHPWIFSGAIESDTSQIEDGEVVTATDNRGNFLAIGHFQHATIALRVLSFENVSIDQVFFQHRIENAVELRRKLGLFNNENTICRLIHGEGDSLPGLIIDYYNGCAVIQCHSIGMYRSVELISVSLQKALKENLKAVYSKSSDTLSQRSDIVDAYIYGNCETPHIAHEYGVKLNIDWINGQKTGFFVDQRENRALLGKYAKGKKILNTFCYSGGFS